MTKRKLSVFRMPIALTDVLFNLLMVFASLFFLSLMIVNEPKKVNAEANVKKDAQYIIQVDWPDGLKSDIDVWVKSPLQDMVSYMRTSTNMMNLERDDRGEIDDYEYVNGEKIINPKNQEIIVLRGSLDGIYYTNIYLYSKKDDVAEIPVTVRFIKLNPKYEEVLERKIILQTSSQEESVFAFMLKSDGTLISKDIATNEKFIGKYIVKRALGGGTQ